MKNVPRNFDLIFYHCHLKPTMIELVFYINKDSGEWEGEDTSSVVILIIDMIRDLP